MTYIFVLLLFFCWIKKTSAHVTMRKYNEKVIDINATADKLGEKWKCGADDICANKHTQSMTLVESHDYTSDDEYDNDDYY